VCWGRLRSRVGPGALIFARQRALIFLDCELLLWKHFECWQISMFFSNLEYFGLKLCLNFADVGVNNGKFLCYFAKRHKAQSYQIVTDNFA
jgi:hypothetical protein